MNLPKYAALAEKIRDQIDSGHFKCGERITPVSQLREEYGYSKTTIAAAIQQLEDEGLVEVRQGFGTIVRDRLPLVRVVPDRYHRPHTTPTWAREAERSGRTVDVNHDSKREPSSFDVAGRLGIEPGDDVIATKYLIKMDGQPISMSTAYEAYSLVGGTDIERPHEGAMAGRGIVPRFDSIGQYVTRVQEKLKFRAATTEEDQALQLRGKQWVVEVNQTFRAEDGAPIEVADIVFPANRYEFVYSAEIPLSRAIADKQVAEGGDGMPWPFGTD